MCEYAVIELQFDAIQPEAVIARVGEPGAGLGLFGADDDAFDGVGPHAAHTRDLLRDADAGAGRVMAGEDRHGSEV